MVSQPAGVRPADRPSGTGGGVRPDGGRLRVALGVIAGKRGGPGTYGIALARALARRDDVDCVVLTERPGLFPGLETVALRGPRPWCDHVTIPRLLDRLAPDVFHHTKNALPWRTRHTTVVTLHDLAYYHFPETFGPLARRYLRWHHEHAARRADGIVAVSEHARRDIVATLGVDPGRVRVVFHGVDPRFHDSPAPVDFGLDDPVVLSVGTIQARKNLDVLVRAVARLRDRGGPVCTLAIAGRRGWKTEAFDEACRRTNVRLLGVVASERLPALYAQSAVFVQPSSYEGFGLTVIEAMACGTPVIAAAAGSLPEVVGEAGVLVEPRDERALAAALRGLLEDPARRRELAAAGRARAARFTWERSAAGHVQAYREAIARRARA